MANPYKNIDSTMASTAVLRYGNTSLKWINGRTKTPYVGGPHPIYKPITRAFTLISLAITVYVIGLCIYTYAWDSPLVAETDATIQSAEYGPEGLVMKYTYVVDGKTLAATEVRNQKLHKPDATEPVIFFKARPDVVTLKMTREPFDMFICFLSLFFFGSLAYVGVISRKKVPSHILQLEEEASHVLPGKVTKRQVGKTSAHIDYEFQEPGNGDRIQSFEFLDINESSLPLLIVGADVAVIYASSRNFRLI